MSIRDDLEDPERWKKRAHGRSLLLDLHRLFGLTYTQEDGEHGITSEYADYRLQLFLDMLAEFMPEVIADRIQQICDDRKAQNASRLIGGPFDGEPIEVSTWGRTFAMKVRPAWWAVYKRKDGQLPAMFVGFATSEVKAKTYQLAHATAAAEIKPIPPKTL